MDKIVWLHPDGKRFKLVDPVVIKPGVPFQCCISPSDTAETRERKSRVDALIVVLSSVAPKDRLKIIDAFCAMCGEVREQCVCSCRA